MFLPCKRYTNVTDWSYERAEIISWGNSCKDRETRPETPLEGVLTQFPPRTDFLRIYYRASDTLTYDHHVKMTFIADNMDMEPRWRSHIQGVQEYRIEKVEVVRVI